MIRFPCPRCDAALKAPDGRAGQSLTCPKCQRAISVPNSLDDEPPAAELDDGPRHKIPRWAWAAGAAVVLIAVIASVLVTARLNRGTPGTSDPAAAEVEKIQGRWTVVSVAMDSVAAENLTPDERDALDRSIISFEGSQMRTFFPHKSDRAAYLLNPHTSPKQITVTWEHQHVNGSVDDGIYEFSGGPTEAVPRPPSEARAPDVL